MLYTYTSFTSNLMMALVLFFVNIGLLVVLGLLFIVHKKIELIKVLYEKLHTAMIWNTLIRYLFENYLVLLLSGVLQWQAGLIWSDPLNVFNSVLTISMCVSCFVLPIVITYYLRKR